MAGVPHWVGPAMWAWPFVEQAARERMTTAALWETIKSVAPEETYWRSTQFASALGVLRRYANENLRAQASLDAASRDWSLSRDYIGNAPYGRSLAEQNTLGRWQVRVPVHGVGSHGESVEQMISVMYTGTLPPTVGDLIDEATQAAVNKAYASDFEVIDTGTPQILTA